MPASHGIKHYAHSKSEASLIRFETVCQTFAFFPPARQLKMQSSGKDVCTWYIFRIMLLMVHVNRWCMCLRVFCLCFILSASDLDCETETHKTRCDWREMWRGDSHLQFVLVAQQDFVRTSDDLA